MLENKIHNIIDLRKSGETTPTITHIPTSWDDKDLGDLHYEYTPKTNMGFVTKLFLFSFAIFLIATSFAAFNFYKNSNGFSQDNIDFAVTAPAAISGGEDNTVPVIVTNRNAVPILSSYVIMSYDAGQNVSGASNITQKRVDLGDIASNAVANRSFDLTLFGNEGDARKLSATLFYSIAGSKAVYNKDLPQIVVTIKSSPVTLTVNSFKEMHVNDLYDFDIIIKNNTNSTIQNLIVSARNPNDFIYASSSLPLLNKNPSWLIASLSAGTEKKITMTGKLSGTIGTNENFTFYVGTSNQSATTTLNKKVSTTTSKLSNNNFDNYNLSLTNIYSQINKSILLADQYLDVKLSNDSSLSGSTVSAGDNLSLEFAYKNNLNYPIDNVTFSAKLSGDMLDTVNTNAIRGNFDPSTGIATWDKTTMGELSQIPASGGGKFILNVRASRNVVTGGNIKMQVMAHGDRNAEDSVYNVQDISLEKTWNVSQ